MAKRGRDPDKLTPLEERFVLEYLVDEVAVQAYLRASPKVKSYMAAAKASAVLGKNPKIQRAIEEEQKRRRERLRAEADQVVLELARIAFADVGQACDLTADEVRLLPPRKIPLDTRRAIVSLKTKRRIVPGRGKGKGKRGKASDVIEEAEYKFADKVGALRQLAQHLGLLKDPVPLESLLNLLPVELRESTRAAIARAVFGGGSAAGAGGDRPGPTAEVRQPDPPEPPGESKSPVRGDGVEAGLLAAPVPAEPVEAVEPPLFEAGGQIDQHGGDGAPHGPADAAE